MSNNQESPSDDPFYIPPEFDRRPGAAKATNDNSPEYEAPDPGQPRQDNVDHPNPDLHHHISMLHQLAEGIDGKLILASYGQNPKTGKAIPARVLHFEIGDIDGMVAAAEELNQEPHRNVYAPMAVLRPDLPTGKKGKLEDVIAVLGLVADFDLKDDPDAGKYAERMPLAHNFVVETSPGSFQVSYVFDCPHSVEDAKPIAECLAEHAGCDHRTKDVSGVWRLPGTKNWPNKKKVEAGRPVDPTLAKAVEPWAASVTTLEGLRAALPPLEQPQFEPSPPEESGQADPGPTPPRNFDDLPGKLQDLIRDGVSEGRRSEQFHGALGWLKKLGWSQNDAANLLRQYPGGIAEKFVDRLDDEVGRSWPKLSAGDEDDDRPTYDDCSKAAEALSEDSTPAEINEVMKKSHRAKLSAVERTAVLKAIKAATGTPMGDLRDGFKEIKNGNSSGCEDLGHLVAKKVLAIHYGGGHQLVRAIDKSFWRYNGQHWGRQTDEQVQNLILHVIDTDKDCDPVEITYNGLMKQAFSLLTAMQAKEGDVLKLTEEPAPVINCANGELWFLDKGGVDLRPHNFASYLTYVLNVQYDPSATCPRFDQALLDTFAKSSDPNDMARHFCEFMGYAIQPRRDVPAWFMLSGRGRNGKTKLMETIERLMSSAAIHSDRLSNLESNRFAMGAIAGKLVLYDDDVDTGTKLPDGLIKKLSERKLLTGELKFKDTFEFVATCLPVLLANNLPITADLTYGMRRRAHIIPFDRVFTDEDADDTLFPYIWANELPGVLNRAIEGLQRLRARGRFDQPNDCKEAMSKWLVQANPLTAFIDEACCKDLAAHILLSDFYRMFTQWAGQCGIRSIPARNTVKSNLENLGYKVQRTAAGNSVLGLDVRGGF